MRRRTSSIEALIPGGSIEVSGTAAVPPDRCDGFGPAVFQVEERLRGLVEAPFGRLGDAVIEDSHHAPRHILARELQALHGVPERFLDDGAASGAASPEGAVQKRQDLVTAAQPAVQLGGILLAGLAHFEPGPRPSVGSGFKACALRFSSWIRS